MAPLTLSDSSTWLCSSAIVRWRWVVMSRRTSATLRVSQVAGGRITRESRESRQSRIAIAIAVPTAVVMLDATDVAVLVITD